MQDVPAPYGGESPLFSIIIPLEHHRGQWELSWLGWTSQTADKSLYEIILVVPPDFKALNELKALAGGKARLEFTNSDHDIGLCAFGATKARGKYLFFTESHCRPEPDVMEATRVPTGRGSPVSRCRSAITGCPWRRPPCTRPTSSSA
ncbi:hypothetical protein ABIF74_009669 [Bradyrhizobium japonicum]